MKKHTHWENAKDDFTALMYQKGYRGRVGVPQANRQLKFYPHLGACLEDYLAQRESGSNTATTLDFQTTAGNQVTCKFQVSLDDVEGFRVRELKVIDQATNQQKHYRGFYANHQVPGTAQVSMLFPKPKPWMKYYKGRFRP